MVTIPKVLEIEIVGEYLEWKNKYFLIKYSAFGERERGIINRFTRYAACKKMAEVGLIDPEFIGEVYVNGLPDTQAAMAAIKNGTKQDAMEAILSGLGRYQQTMERFFEDYFSETYPTIFNWGKR